MAKKKHATSIQSNKTTHLKHAADEHHFDKDAQTDNMIKRHVKLLVPKSNTHAKSRGKIGKPVVKEWTIGVGGTRQPKPERHLMNFTFEDPTDSSKFVNDFDPPVELRVPLSADEVGQSLELWYWDGKQWADVPDAWLVTEAGKKFWVDNYEFVAQLKHWPDDPPSGMGP